MYKRTVLAVFGIFIKFSYKSSCNILVQGRTVDDGKMVEGSRVKWFYQAQLLLAPWPMTDECTTAGPCPQAPTTGDLNETNGNESYIFYIKII